jgi:hypothetical protein
MDRVPPASDSSRSDRWLTAAFLMFLSGLCIAVTFLLLRDGNSYVLLVALLSGALLLALERFEIGYFASSTSIWNPLPGHVAPVITIFLAALVAYLPTLRINFNSDAIAFIHLFHAPSLSQFLRLFLTDLSQSVGGVTVQELRPLYGLSYMLSYSLWGLSPVGYHLDGILLHFLNATTIFVIVRTVAPDKTWRAGLAGLLFALLPANAESLASINGSLTEGVPTWFYLSAFLCFMLFRRSGLTRYLVLSATAFTACLLSKETAVTLPLMLFSYDVFGTTVGKEARSAGGNPSGRQSWRRLVLPHAPFVTLLLAYLALRKVAFSSFLKEDSWERTWGLVAHTGSLGLTGILHQLAQLLRYFEAVQGFNVRNLLLPFPVAVMGLVLGLYMAWALFILRRPSECRRSLVEILYFGLVWYVISSAPLLAVHVSVGHLYLPSAGPCIATAFLAVPICAQFQKRAGYLRLVGAFFLVCLCGRELWKENIRWARAWGEMLDAPSQLAASLQELPGQALVIIWYAGGQPTAFRWTEEILPYSLQPPFTSTDIYSRLRIIEAPEMYCCPVAQWWDKTKLVLASQLAGPQEERIDVHLFAWDWRCRCFQKSRRVMAKVVLRACVAKSLGRPPEQVDSLQPGSAEKLMEALAACCTRCSTAAGTWSGGSSPLPQGRTDWAASGISAQRIPPAPTGGAVCPERERKPRKGQGRLQRGPIRGVREESLEAARIPMTEILRTH